MGQPLGTGVLETMLKAATYLEAMHEARDLAERVRFLKREYVLAVVDDSPGSEEEHKITMAALEMLLTEYGIHFKEVQSRLSQGMSLSPEREAKEARAAAVKGLIGQEPAQPDMFDIHTPNEDLRAKRYQEMAMKLRETQAKLAAALLRRRGAQSGRAQAV